MAEERVQRRLAAILAADVVGYSRLMREDEAGTRRRFNAHLRELIDPTISGRDGRIVKTTGDGLLVEFASVLDAVECAVEIQQGVRVRNASVEPDQRIQFRIGVNLGDVIIEGEDIHGDGVNVAARLESLAEPGGIYVSGIVRESVRNSLKAPFIDLGDQSIKNIAEPVRVYAVDIDPSGESADASAGSEAIFRLPSIAVLPFENMSGDPNQEYFSDGITEDLITALSRIRQLRVVARNSTFSYKGQSPDVRQVSKELGAQYVIEGSVRKAGDRIRLTAQLIDGVTGNHHWAERYDRDMSDVFAVQDELTEMLIGAISARVGKIERDRSRRKPTEKLDAWDLYQRGNWHLNRRNKEDNEVARALFERSIKIDPQFGIAHSGLAQTCCYDVLFGFAPGDRDLALEAARTAVSLDNEDAAAHLALGIVHYVERNHEDAFPEFERAIELNPSFAEAHYYYGNVLVQTGKAEEGLPYLHNAIRLSPNDDLAGPFHARIAFANLCLGDHESAVEWARKAMRLPSVQWPVQTFLISALAHLGQDAQAQVALENLRKHSPDITIDFVSDHLTVTDPGYREHLLDGLRKAGFPAQSGAREAPLSLPDKPSIAVLPFANMSGDPAQEYFADGMTEDLITALSRIRQFFVTARNTTFTYKGSAVDIPAVARELGVKYVVEGSVRKAGSRARVTAQLIDGATGNHVWAERYDRDLEDIFDLQDELTLTLAAAIEPELAKAERERAAGKKPENLDAWDRYQRGMSLWQTMKKDRIAEARGLFEGAIERDPDFAPAYAGYATTYFQDIRLGFAEGDRDKAARAARRAVELDGEDAQSHLALGMLHYVDRDMGAAMDEFEFAIRLNPSFALARAMLGRALIGAGKAAEAIPHIEQALRLSPRDPVVGPFHAALGRAHLCLGNYEEAIRWARLGQRYQNIGWPLPMILASAFGHLGDMQEAQAAISEMNRLQPGITLQFVETYQPISHRAYTEQILDGLRKAGLPAA